MLGNPASAELALADARRLFSILPLRVPHPERCLRRVGIFLAGISNFSPRPRSSLLPCVKRTELCQQTRLLRNITQDLPRKASAPQAPPPDACRVEELRECRAPAALDGSGKID